MTKPGPAIERRFAPLSDIEVRADKDRDIISFRGHAAVFNQLTEIAGLFREQIAPGSFKKTLQEARDVAFLWNHNPDTVMASTKNGTLRLKEDSTGLLVEADLDAHDWDVQRVTRKLENGAVNQMSFAFRKIRDEWEDQPEDGGLPIRTLTEQQLFDTSPVTFPAYEGTDAELLSLRALASVEPRVKDLMEEHKSEVETEEKSDSPDDDKDSPDEEREEEVDTSGASDGGGKQHSTDRAAEDGAEPEDHSLRVKALIRRTRLEEIEVSLS